MKKNIRYVLIVILVLIYFLVSWVRYSYIVNLTNSNYPLLIAREKPDLEKYPLSFNSLGKSVAGDPRWISSSMYILIFFLITTSIVYLLYLDIHLIKFSLIIYVFFFLLVLSFLMLSFLTGSYEYGYRMAQKFKNLLQEPFISFFVIASMMVIRKYQLNKKP